LLDLHLIENIRILQHARRGTLLLVGMLSVGTVGYMALEGWSFLDALFMTIITLSTIGYGETNPLSPVGRVFTIDLILFGVGTAAYLLAGGTSFFVAGGVEAFRRRQRMHDQLRRITDHTIVCGFGRLGSAIVSELQQRGAKVVMVERNAEAMERLSALRVPYLIGDASQDEVLIAAGIMRARTLVAAVNDDAHNVFLTLSARVLTRDTNPTLHIHGKADDPASLQELKRAGADHPQSVSAVGQARRLGPVRTQAGRHVGVSAQRGSGLGAERPRCGDGPGRPTGADDSVMKRRFRHRDGSHGSTGPILVKCRQRDAGGPVGNPCPGQKGRHEAQWMAPLVDCGGGGNVACELGRL